MRAQAKAEAQVLKAELSEVTKRESALLKMGEARAKAMLAAGERWEKKQLGKIKRAVSKKRRRRSA
jgi:hypothetical protein